MALLTQTTIDKCTFINTTIQQTSFSKVEFEETTFTSCTFKNVDFTGSTFKDVKFDNVTLDETTILTPDQLAGITGLTEEQREMLLQAYYKRQDRQTLSDQRALSIAQKMLEAGEAPEKILEYTGLDPLQLAQLQ